MAVDPSSSAKKHRVIAWKPEAAAERTDRTRRFPKWVTVVAGIGGALLLVAGLFGAFVAYRLDQMQRAATSAAESPEAAPGETLRAAFVGRSRAESAREAAMRGLENVRKTPSEHPAVLRRLIEIERLLLGADKAFGDANYGAAVQQFEAIASETKQFAATLEDMRKAREGYDKFLVEVARMDRLKTFAPEKLESALTSAGAARTFLDQGSFSLARQMMDEAAATLQSIDKDISEQLEQSLAAGRAALAKGDGAGAKAAFERALELQPGNEFAVKSRERAATIEQVFALLASAEKAEAESHFEDAQAAFEKAFAVDAQSATAQAGIARMKSAIRERDFKAAVAKAAKAREERRWNDAIAGYQAALKLFPDDTGVKEALAEARVNQREAFIEESLGTAYDLEREYDWTGARRIYDELLRFDPEQGDAKEGLLRTGKVLRALLKFERLVDDARSQAQRANFQSAISAFNEALANKPSYLALTPEQEELRILLEKQSRAIQITIVSDNKTYITIQGVRLLGRFMSTTVPILPGNYEIIGRRRGYQDVREVIRIRADEPLSPITIVANTRL